LHNDGDQLPKFSGRVLMSHEENWTYGVVEDEKPKLELLLDGGDGGRSVPLPQGAATDAAPALARRDDAGGIVGGESDVA
jgi:hypothetical protein